MNDSKKPGEPVETAGRAQEIQITQLDAKFLCKINGMPIQHVKRYSFMQSSDGTTLLDLTLEISAEAVSTTIQAQTQSHL